MEVGDKLNPQKSFRKGFALKDVRQHIIKTNDPSTIGPSQLLIVRFPNLKVHIPSLTKFRPENPCRVKRSHAKNFRNRT